MSMKLFLCIIVQQSDVIRQRNKRKAENYYKHDYVVLKLFVGFDGNWRKFLWIRSNNGDLYVLSIRFISWSLSI